MEYPYKYTIIDNTTKQMVKQTNIKPLTMDLETWESVEGQPNTKQRVQTKTAYLDVRYKAKLRLYNYITYKKKGLPIPYYKPYKGFEGAILS